MESMAVVAVPVSGPPPGVGASEGLPEGTEEQHDVRQAGDLDQDVDPLRTLEIGTLGQAFGGQVNELFAHKVCKVCHESKNVPAECVSCHRK